MAFSTAAPSGYQNQHVLPIQIMSNPAPNALRNAGLFARDDEANRIALPTKLVAREAIASVGWVLAPITSPAPAPNLPRLTAPPKKS